ncbi:hypothetical protein A9Q84_11840 [Halobacteriovorax marinus]|uniref:Transmembrane protein n=1 Tax=Halobacteriovorax marinus TaxID=97084 RepID=A0A1Y5F7V1_9BACT|nr:hypothetical protein A9Q84_11840 [Halobacteriovorax marinus]
MLGKSLKFSKENILAFSKNSYLYIISLFAVSFLADYVRIILGEANQNASLVLTLIEVVFTYFVYAVLIKAIFIFQSGVTEQNALRQIGIKFFIYLRVNIVYTIVFFIGSMLLVVPGLLALTFFYFAPILVIQKDLYQKSYFRESIKLVKKAPWSVFTISLFSMIVMSLDFAIMPLIKESGFEFLGLFFSTSVVVALDIFLLLAGVRLLEFTQE